MKMPRRLQSPLSLLTDWRSGPLYTFFSFPILLFQGMPIVTIGINRPEKRNSVDTETSEALKVAFQVCYKYVFRFLQIIDN